MFEVFRVVVVFFSSCRFCPITSIISFFVLSVISGLIVYLSSSVSLIYDNEINEISMVSNVDITLFKAKMAISCY